MTKSILTLAALLALTAAIITFAPRQTEQAGRPGPEEAPGDLVKAWPARARAAALAMLEKYGRPSQFDRKTLVWFNNGSWKRTIVYRDGCPGSVSPRKGNIEQAVGYLVPGTRRAGLKSFSSRLDDNASAAELSYCSGSETENFLAINLADEVATGRTTPEDGRGAFERELRLEASGKSSRNRAGLSFEVDNTRHAEPGGDQ